MKNLFLTVTFLLFVCVSNAQDKYKYSVASSPWAEYLGNHRAIMQVAMNTKVAYLNLEWRRHDKNVDKRQFIIVNAATNQRVTNIYRSVVNNE